jgi:DNA-binding CsgD family transcriptional regulator
MTFRDCNGDDSLRIDHTQASANASEIENHAQLAAWVRGPLRELFPHQHAVLVFGSVHSLGIAIEETLCVDLPDSYIAGVRNDAGYIDSPVLSKWQAARELQYFDLETIPHDTHKRWVGNFRNHRLHNGVTDGHVDSSSNTVAFLTLFNVALSVKHSGTALRALGARQIHAAWLKIKQGLHESEHGAISSENILSLVEREIVRWIRLGKTNWEIAQIRGKSEFTIKTQVQRMLKKTGARNRTELADKLS